MPGIIFSCISVIRIIAMIKATNIIKLLTLSLVFLAGCQSKYLKTEYVEGVVTLDGTPVDGAKIGFTPVEGAEGAVEAYGLSDAKGVYKLSTNAGKVNAGTTPGEYIVIVSKVIYTETDQWTIESDGTKTNIPRADNVVPAKYKRVTLSPLRKTVNKGKNIINIELSSQ